MHLVIYFENICNLVLINAPQAQLFSLSFHYFFFRMHNVLCYFLDYKLVSYVPNLSLNEYFRDLTLSLI